MTQDIIDLINFYETPLGQSTATTLRRVIAHLWPEMKTQNFLGVGYPLPFLSFSTTTSPPFIFMPAQQGVIHWPDDSKNLCCLINEDSLPLANESINRIMLIHSLEHSEHVRPYLRELWRILSSNGRLLIVVPNRRGLWAQSDGTPFGQGTSYTMTQLSRLLKESQFTPLQSTRGLYSIPSHSRFVRNISRLLEKGGPFILGKFAGVLCVEAIKEVYCRYDERRLSVPFIRAIAKPSRTYLNISSSLRASPKVNL
jgi:ubiquinone/menaquinone biosynthesis C-methylase UbiE